MFIQRVLLQLSALIVLWGCPARAQEQETKTSIPGQPFELVGTRKVASKRPADIKQGLALFRAFCGRCHGRDGKGGKGPNLVDGSFRRVSTDEQIVEVMTNGISGTGMPGFGPGYEDAYWQITAFLRDSEQDEKQQPVTGDTAHGFELFKKHQCGNCHWTGSHGGRLGPDLSRLAATPDYVRQSFIDPDSHVDGNYQSLQIMLQDGRIISGRRLYENSHFILVMTLNENLATIAKDQIAILRRLPKSLMLSFAEHLTAADARDLTAYIFTLQNVPKK